MTRRYEAVFPWDFERKEKAEDEVESLMHIWATFLQECQHPFHSKFPRYPNPTPGFIASWLAETTVKSCMTYGDKMTLEHWEYMVDSLLGWLEDKKAAKKLCARNVPISSEYRWYGVFAWHELRVSANNVRNEILAERIKVKAEQDSIATAVMAENRSCYPERWELNHNLCFSCSNAVKKPYPENYPWCKIYIKTGQPADRETCAQGAKPQVHRHRDRGEVLRDSSTEM